MKVRYTGFIGLALISFTSLSLSCLGQKKVKVGLDYYFNNEYKKDPNGNPYRFHYIWEDTTDSGFSMWGVAFNESGAETVSIKQAPITESLKDVDIYIIVDPDTKKETEQPNFINEGDIKAITAWVKAGGKLVLMANDSSNTELDHFNKLAMQFGIRFNKDCKNKVTGQQFEMGKILIPKPNAVFQDVQQIYIKEFASLSLELNAKPILVHKGDVVMAVAKIGKGTVFAVGDPWLYNEYANQSRLSADYQNFKAGKALARWLLKQ